MNERCPFRECGPTTDKRPVVFPLPTLGGWGVFVRRRGKLLFIKRYMTEQEADDHVRNALFLLAVGDARAGDAGE